MESRKTLMDIGISAAAGAVLGTLLAITLGASGGGIFFGVVFGALAGGLLFRPKEVWTTVRKTLAEELTAYRNQRAKDVRYARAQADRRAAAKQAKAEKRLTEKQARAPFVPRLVTAPKVIGAVAAFVAFALAGLGVGGAVAGLPFYLLGSSIGDAVSLTIGLALLGLFGIASVGDTVIPKRNPLLLPIHRRMIFRKRAETKQPEEDSGAPAFLLGLCKTSFFAAVLPIAAILYYPVFLFDALLTLALVLASSERSAVMLGAGTGALVASSFVATGGLAALALMLAAVVGGCAGMGAYRLRLFVLEHPVACA